MSKHTTEYLSEYILVGAVDQRGKAWHANNSAMSEANHFQGAIPLERVKELFAVEALTTPVTATYTYNGEERTIVDLNKVHIVHPHFNVICGTFSAGFRIHQYNDWIVDNVQKTLGRDLYITGAGLLSWGAVGYVEISTLDTMVTPEGVSYKTNLLAATSMDGSLATTYKIVNNITVCDNTLAGSLAERADHQWKMKHTSRSMTDERIDQAREALQVVMDHQRTFADEVKALCETTVTDQQWASFLEAHVPTTDEAGDPLKGRGLTLAENKRESLSSLWKNDERVSPWKNTAYGVLQADNTYRLWEGTVRGMSRPERVTLNALKGVSQKADQDALTLLNGILANA
jgi:phage/plasmid-like protein (TIGR03299 family)